MLLAKFKMAYTYAINAEYTNTGFLGHAHLRYLILKDLTVGDIPQDSMQPIQFATAGQSGHACF